MLTVCSKGLRLVVLFTTPDMQQIWSNMLCSLLSWKAQSPLNVCTSPLWLPPSLVLPEGRGARGGIHTEPVPQTCSWKHTQLHTGCGANMRRAGAHTALFSSSRPSIWLHTWICHSYEYKFIIYLCSS